MSVIKIANRVTFKTWKRKQTFLVFHDPRILSSPLLSSSRNHPTMLTFVALIFLMPTSLPRAGDLFFPLSIQQRFAWNPCNFDPSNDNRPSHRAWSRYVAFPITPLRATLFYLIGLRGEKAPRSCESQAIHSIPISFSRYECRKSNICVRNRPKI